MVRLLDSNASYKICDRTDHTIWDGSMPNSDARAQLRDIRAADPDATIVLTDFENPSASPLVYPPGTQPPPSGPLPRGTSNVVNYP